MQEKENTYPDGYPQREHNYPRYYPDGCPDGEQNSIPRRPGEKRIPDTRREDPLRKKHPDRLIKKTCRIKRISIAQRKEKIITIF